MNKQEIFKLQGFSELVGNFIRYWGFRKIHGEIWTLVYLSKKPLSGAEIVDLLQVSKALVSPALKELEAEGLIFPAKSENAKTKRYEAEEDVAKIIRNVLKRREMPMISKIFESYLDLQSEASKDGALNTERLQKLGGLIQTAQIGLIALANSEHMWD